MATLELQMVARPRAWSTNEDRNQHPMARAELVALWNQAAFLTLRNWRKRVDYWDYFPFTIVQLVITFPTKDRAGRAQQKGKRDPHNYCGTVLKAVVDGLEKAKAWPNDGPEYVGHRECLLVIEDENPTIRLWCADGSEPWEI